MVPWIYWILSEQQTKQKHICQISALNTKIWADIELAFNKKDYSLEN